MSWFMTADTGQFLAAAGEFLRAEPARNSVMLTVRLAPRFRHPRQRHARLTRHMGS